MKKVSILALIALGGLTATVTSCKKEDPAKALELNLEQTATIKGKFIVANNDRDSIAKFTTLSKLDIYATVDLGALSTNANSGILVVENVSYDATTGEFTIIAPVSNNGSTVNYTFGKATGKYLTKELLGTDTLGDPIYANKEIEVIYDLSQYNNSVYLTKGQVYDLGTEILADKNENAKAGDEYSNGI